MMSVKFLWEECVGDTHNHFDSSEKTGNRTVQSTLLQFMYMDLRRNLQPIFL